MTDVKTLILIMNINDDGTIIGAEYFSDRIGVTRLTKKTCIEEQLYQVKADKPEPKLSQGGCHAVERANAR